VLELKFPELNVEGLKLKTKTIHAVELANIMKSAKSGADPHDIYVPKLFWFNQAHSLLLGVYIPRISVPKKALGPFLFSMILYIR
jgi:hypothetical protein